MKLKGNFKVKNILKKTSAKFFKDLTVGDEFELMYDINGGYHSAPSINIYVEGVLVHWNNASQLADNLNKFELEEIHKKEN